MQVIGEAKSNYLHISSVSVFVSVFVSISVSVCLSVCLSLLSLCLSLFLSVCLPVSLSRTILMSVWVVHSISNSLDTPILKLTVMNLKNIQILILQPSLYFFLAPWPLPCPSPPPLSLPLYIFTISIRATAILLS